MKFFYPTIIFLLFLLFFSCATNKNVETFTKETLSPVYVTNKIKVLPLPTNAIKEEISAYQVFSGSFKMKGITKEFSSPVYLEADENGIVIMMLTDFGMETGTIYYDGKEAKIESSFFPKNIKCEYIILDLQNAYCDTDALKSHYEKNGLNFTEKLEDEKTIRSISNKKKVIEEITISKKEIIIKNLLRKYSYRLELCE